MKKGTKKIIISALTGEIRRLKSAVEYCKGKSQFEELQAIKLEHKIEKLQRAISEVEVC
jgi:hypothetical protein